MLKFLIGNRGNGKSSTEEQEKHLEHSKNESNSKDKNATEATASANTEAVKIDKELEEEKNEEKEGQTDIKEAMEYIEQQTNVHRTIERVVEGVKCRLDLMYMNVDNKMMQMICLVLKDVKELTEIDLKNAGISTEAAITLFSFLKKQKNVNWIRLSGNKIGDNAMTSAASYLYKNNTLHKLFLDATALTDAGIKILAPALFDNRALHSLNLSMNPEITDKSTPFLKEVAKTTHLEELNLDGTSISEKAREEIESFVKNNVKNSLLNTLKEGDATDAWFSSLEVDDTFIEIFCETFRVYGNNVSLVSFASNKLTSKGIKLLCDCLIDSESVKEVDLSSNPFDDDCVQAVANLLALNKNIEKIWITNCDLNDSFFEDIAQVLMGNRVLSEFDIRDNKNITTVSLQTLKELATSSSVTRHSGSSFLEGTSIKGKDREEVDNLLLIPIEDRDIPYFSQSKSAAKSS